MIDLPVDLEYSDINVIDNLQFQELYSMISDNYISGIGGEFALRYSPELLKWALTPPGWKKEWCIGVFNVKAGRTLVGFVSGVPSELYENGEKKSVAQINFLCVHKEYRKHNLARCLIDKVASRLVSSGQFSNAIYTVSSDRGGAFCNTKYYHRILNVKKAIKSGFFQPTNSTRNSLYERLYRLPTKTSKEYRRACRRDIPVLLKLLNDSYTSSGIKLYPVFTESLLEYMFFSCIDIHCYISYDNECMFSYYSLPYDVLGDGSSILKAAYMYYSSTGTNTSTLLDMLIKAKASDNMDVFNCTDTLKVDFKNLKFIKGTGNLFYYKFYRDAECDKCIYNQYELGVYMV